MRFVERQRELAALDRLWSEPGARFMVLYGRRRIGKTRLLTHWLGTRSPRSAYWVAKPASSATLLRSFSHTVRQLEFPGSEVDPSFSLPSWEMAWREVARLAADEPLALCLDEFTYTLDASPELSGTLQNAWDHQLSKTHLRLILSGSHIGMMEREVLAYRAPLYGRAELRLLLEQLPFRALKELFPHWEADQRVVLYGVLGGIPAYLERFDPDLSLPRNIRERLLTPNNLLQEEPRFLLQEQLSDPRNYMSILEAIAQNHRDVSSIAESAGLAKSHLSKYLSTLRSLRLVNREVPVTARHPARSRQGRYQLTDPYLRFYFRFLVNRQDEIALGRIEATWRRIRRHMAEFIGGNTFEELCREWVSQEGDKGRLPFYPERVGSLWNSKAQIDVAAIDWAEKQILLGECKWHKEPVGRLHLRQLLEKRGSVVPAGPWTVHWAFFSRRGFTDPARRLAEEHGILLVDLDRLDADLSAT